MPYLRIQIVRFVDEQQPGFVAGEFTDTQGCRHTIIDKVPVIGVTDLWSDSKYPQPGAAKCEILERLQDGEGRKLSRITIDKPWSLESVDGQTEFVVFDEQLTDALSAVQAD